MSALLALAASAIGWAVMTCAAIIALALAIELRFGPTLFKVCLLGFGVAWIDAEANSVLRDNMLRAGFRLRRLGRWAWDWQMPRWFRHIVLRANKD